MKNTNINLDILGQRGHFIKKINKIVSMLELIKYLNIKSKFIVLINSER